MKSDDYSVISSVIFIIGVVVIIFIFSRRNQNFKSPILNAKNIFIGKNQINDKRPTLIYVHNGCPCLQQPLGTTFQSMANEFQTKAAFYELKYDESKLNASSIPFVAFFIDGNYFNGFNANTLNDFQSWFSQTGLDITNLNTQSQMLTEFLSSVKTSKFITDKK